jgi:N-acyl-D-aspartate/D-glutamate deacylase
MPRYRADVGLSGDRIAAIGRIRERGKEEIDATGHVVSPGFIDGHTHMDAQVFWDPLGSCSCWHGVTTAVMGNCGFTLAPGSADQRDMILSNIIRAEDISADAMAAAIRWDWTSFREYMNVVDKLPKAINYAANIGHSALRTHVMGPRAFEQQASHDDLGAMEHELLDALDAGAIGFTSSLSTGHKLPEPDNRPVASNHASWEELSQLVCLMGTTGRGIFEYAREREARSPDAKVRKPFNDRLLDLAVKSGVPITFGIPAGSPGVQDALNLLDATADAGGRMFGQTHTRGISHMLSFKGRLQFDDLPEWKQVRALPIEEQRKAFTDPEQRKRLIDATKKGVYRTGGGEPRKPTYENMYVVYSAVSRNPSVAELAAQRKVDPVEVMMDLALGSDFNQLFMQFDMTTVPKSDAEALATLRHPRTVMTFSDSGAHVSLIMDSSIHTHLLAYWVRERNAFSLEEGVKMITLTPAMAWGFTDRGLLRQGCIADLNIFDPATLAPQIPTIEHDLPTGARRLKQKSTGIMATIIAGQVAFRDGEHTGALGGRLLRSTAAGVR